MTISQERKRELLMQFNENEELKHVLKQELLKGIYSNGVQRDDEEHEVGRNWALTIAWNDEISPEQKGHLLMAVSEGLRSLESAFSAIEKNYKRPELKKEPEPNPGR